MKIRNKDIREIPAGDQLEITGGSYLDEIAIGLALGAGLLACPPLLVGAVVVGGVSLIFG